MRTHPGRREARSKYRRLRQAALAFGLFCGSMALGVSPAAAANDYPYPNASWTAADPWGFYYRECTSFAAWRMNVLWKTTRTPWSFVNQLWGPSDPNAQQRWGNAGDWDDYAISHGFVVSSVPLVGAIAHWNPNEPGAGSFGHVAVVTSVAADGTVTIEDYNAAGTHAFRSKAGVRAPRYIYIAAKCAKKTLGDANCDNYVNVVDYEIWRREYGGSIGSVVFTTKRSDFNGDGRVNLIDYEIWRRNAGR